MLQPPGPCENSERSLQQQHTQTVTPYRLAAIQHGNVGTSDEVAGLVTIMYGVSHKRGRGRSIADLKNTMDVTLFCVGV